MLSSRVRIVFGRFTSLRKPFKIAQKLACAINIRFPYTSVNTAWASVAVLSSFTRNLMLTRCSVRTHCIFPTRRLRESLNERLLQRDRARRTTVPVELRVEEASTSTDTFKPAAARSMFAGSSQHRSGYLIATSRICERFDAAATPISMMRTHWPIGVRPDVIFPTSRRVGMNKSVHTNQAKSRVFLTELKTQD